ncbi:MAG: polyprenyl synthetase family protein [Alphaproteobacteria bacterium]|nr:polyprenyl synthetase family protein [Alphaproteobacteria bacterium]
MNETIEAALAANAARIEAALEAFLPKGDGYEAALHEAMRYASLGGGKRIRPFLVMETAGLFGVDEACALRVACAIELVHCYSLVHDDLPAMDDDDLRRGRPTVHKAFDEATAILAGDALLTRAFEILSQPLTHGDAGVRADLVLALAIASGAEGMCGGQMMDLAAEGQDLDIGEITRLQRLKTGALIGFAAQSGAILGKAPAHMRHTLVAFAHDLGLAFQIADDLIDVEGSAVDAGKATGKDQARGKATFVSILGVERARAQAQLLADQAARHLDMFDSKADRLRRLARWVVQRRN